MSLAMSVFSDKIITPKGLGTLMARLNAKVDVRGGWSVERRDRVVNVRLASQDIDELHEDDILPVARLLGAVPRSRVALIFHPMGDDFELRMARAIAVAMAEIWPVVLDDHAGNVEVIAPPGAPKK